MNFFLADTFTWMLRGTAQAAVAVVVVLAVHTLFRRRLPARWKYALWLAVPAAWLLPRIPQTPISVARYANPEIVRYVYTIDAVLDAAPSIAPPTTNVAPRPPRRLAWQEITGVVWITGALGLGAWWSIGHRRAIRRLRRSSAPPDAALVALLEECRAATGLRHSPDVIESRGISSPAVTGVLRPLLVIPEGLSQRYSTEELRLMLLHELAHIRRGDLVTNAAATAMLAVHWFNPMIWFAAARVRADRESACDETVLALAETDARAAYGGTLLKLQTQLSGAPACPAVIGILEGTRRLRDRILRIAAFRRGGTAWGLGAVLVTGGILACIAADPPAAKPERSPPPTSAPSLEQRLRQHSAKTQQVHVQSLVLEPSKGLIERMASIEPKIKSTLPTSDAFALVSVIDAQKVANLIAMLPAPPTAGNGQAPALTPNNVDQLIFRGRPSPTVTTRNGQRAVIEIIREFRHPVKWEDPDPKLKGAPATPTEFETRNLGYGFEVEPTVPVIPTPLENAWIDVDVAPFLTFLVGWEKGKTPRGLPTSSPRFSASKRAATNVTILDGHTIVLMGDFEIPDDYKWDNPKIGEPGDKIKTHRGTVLWLVTARLINSRGEPGITEGGLAPELFAPRDWQFTNMPIEQCVAHFTGMSRLIDPQKRGLNIVLGKPAAETRHVTLDLRQTNLINALELAAKAAGFRAEEGGSNTVILTP